MMKKQAGVTLIEIVIALGIMSAVVAGTAALIDRSAEDTRGAVAAQHLRTIGDAANVYIKDNYTAVMANATPTTPALIRVSDLIAGGYLQAGFSMTNTYNQNACVLVLEPTANNLTALVITESGTALDDLTLGGLAGITGAAGGGVYTTATTTVRGAMGGWSMAIGNYANANHLGQKCDGTAGVATLAVGHPAMALWFANGDSTAGFLYRDAVPGRPELNQMNTPLIMMATATAATACTTTGAISRDAAGAVLSCQGGTWKGGSGGLNWKGSVANFASLPASGNSSGDAYRVTGLSNHVFVWDTQNSVWQGMVVDGSGNLSLPGLIYTAGSNSNYGAITMQGSKNGWSGINFKDSAGSSAGTLMMHPSYSGFFNAADNAWRWYVTDGGNSYQAGTAQANMLQVDGVVTENTACSPNGLVARDSTGLILSCQSGIWKKGGGITTSGGISQVWKSIAGQSISCTLSNGYTGYANVDANGIYSVRMHPGGWIAGTCTTAGTVSGPATACVSLAGLSVVQMDTSGFYLSQCSAKWS